MRGLHKTFLNNGGLYYIILYYYIIILLFSFSIFHFFGSGICNIRVPPVQVTLAFFSHVPVSRAAQVSGSEAPRVPINKGNVGNSTMGTKNRGLSREDKVLTPPLAAAWIGTSVWTLQMFCSQIVWSLPGYHQSAIPGFPPPVAQVARCVSVSLFLLLSLLSPTAPP